VPDVFSSAVAALNTTLAAYASVEGTYTRKDGRSADLTVTLGRTEREQTQERGIVAVIRSQDITFATSDFEDAFGEDERPTDGDTFERDGLKFAVRPLAGEPAYRDSDAGGLRLRVHLKAAGKVP
jgi:hypothetical protein